MRLQKGLGVSKFFFIVSFQFSFQTKGETSPAIPSSFSVHSLKFFVFILYENLLIVCCVFFFFLWTGFTIFVTLSSLCVNIDGYR